MQALGRFRWVLPAIGIPVAIAAVCITVQAAAFERPAHDSLVAAAALRELLRYRVMRSSEEIGGHRLTSVCIQGWFHSPLRRRPVRGDLVLLGNGERLYDVGTGVRRLGRLGRVSRLDRARFLLAGCPRVVGEDVTARLVHALPLDLEPGHADGSAVISLAFGRPHRPIDFFVALRTYRPLALSLGGQQLRGRSDLDPGGGRSLIARVRQAFDLGRGQEVVGA